jgi:DNA uptake protein ComE-like DNA-binding protein
LRAIGVKENIAKIIIKYKNESKGIPTWKEIDDLTGIGEKTLVYLKEHIDLS